MPTHKETAYQICDIMGWRGVLRHIAGGECVQVVFERLGARLGVLGLEWRASAPTAQDRPEDEIHNRALAAALRAGKHTFTHPELLAVEQLSQTRHSFVRVGGACFRPHEPECCPVPQQMLRELARRVTDVAYSRIWSKVQESELAFAGENNGCSIDDACFAALRAEASTARTIGTNTDVYQGMYMHALCDDMCESWAKYELSTRISLPYELAVWNRFVRSLPDIPGAGLPRAFAAWRDTFPQAMRITHTMALAARVVAEAGAETSGENIIQEMEVRMRERMVRNFAIEMPPLSGNARNGAALRDMRARLDAHGLEYDCLFSTVDYFIRSRGARGCTGAALRASLRRCPIGGDVGTPTCACGARFTPTAAYPEHCCFDCQHANAAEGNRLADIFDPPAPAGRLGKDKRLLRMALIFLLHKDTYKDDQCVLSSETVLKGLSRFMVESTALDRAL